MNHAGRDPAEAAAQILALVATLGVTLLFVVAKLTPQPGSRAHTVNQVELSVVAPPRDEPKPQPRAEKRAPLPVRRVRVTQPVPHRQTIAAMAPQPVSTPQTPPAPSEAAAPAEPQAASMPAGPADPNLAYELVLHANVSSRTCTPDTPEYRLLKPAGTARVVFTIDRTGAVSAVRIAASSGSTILDKQAYAIVSSGHYPPMPPNVFAGEASHLFRVDVEFRRGGGCAS
jgi:protein TonB